MSASSDSNGTRRTKASVQDAIGKLIGDDAACERARRDADEPAPAEKPPAKE
ncbi:hypothetical protein [Sphingomonas sp. Leaf4]|uniref:hypothetical protein n=1 Tax=Sphingomonas sp. Leaf4 TaxID=2876553 RepID=UPI001E5E94F0|nr:hypothetical protein [Sphingomonas sp. Leaf4]